MKEDIKNLEEIINLSKEEIENNNENITAILDLEDLKSLENLLTRYKEERDLRIHFENRLDNMEQLYIDKDKVKEKIEELETRMNNYKYNDDWCIKWVYGRKVLQELLRER